MQLFKKNKPKVQSYNVGKVKVTLHHKDASFTYYYVYVPGQIELDWYSGEQRPYDTAHQAYVWAWRSFKFGSFTLEDGSLINSSLIGKVTFGPVEDHWVEA